MAGQIMTPKHPQWTVFVATLEGPGYCNFHEEKPGDPKSARWYCGGVNNKDFADSILKKMGGFDVSASLDYFETQGGHCDCEIIFNIAYSKAR